jgi:hypothetical protein
METVQRVPEGAYAPLSRKYRHLKICYDCAAAELLITRRTMGMPLFIMARIAVGNERQEQYRLPGAPMGLVKLGFVRPSKPGDLDEQLAWLNENRWFGTEDREEA